MKIISMLATSALILTGSAGADAQTVGKGAPAASIENRQVRGAPAAVAKKRGTRCRIVKQAGRTRQVCSKAPVRR